MATITKTTRDLLKAFQPKLEAAIQKDHKIFALNQPYTITAKKRNGEFRKVPLIGGEEFQLASCYMGKRDGLIMVFKPNYPADYAFMEMPAHLCLENLDKFEAWVNEVVEMDIKEATREARATAEAAEAAEYTKVRQAEYGETFGSW